jgi:hypothetical protein
MHIHNNKFSFDAIQISPESFAGVPRAFRNAAEMAEYRDSSCAAIPVGRPIFYRFWI